MIKLIEQQEKQEKEKDVRFRLERKFSMLFNNKLFTREVGSQQHYLDLKSNLKKITSRKVEKQEK